jgi:hypothetical protein
MGPIWESEPVSIVKAEPPGAVGGGSRRPAHASTPLGTRLKARSQVGLDLCRDVVRRGRAGQAFLIREPGVVGRATVDSLAADRRGPRQDGRVAKTKLRTRSCWRILDQSLGPSRARSARNRPLERTARHDCRAGSRVGWTSRPLTPIDAHFAGNTRSGRGRAALIHAPGGSESLPLIR